MSAVLRISLEESEASDDTFQFGTIKISDGFEEFQHPMSASQPALFDFDMLLEKTSDNKLTRKITMLKDNTDLTA
jgi:hypothetical protein